MNNKYFTTRSFTFAISIQYVTGQSYYKFQNEKNETIYSFEKTPSLMEKLKKLDELRFS